MHRLRYFLRIADEGSISQAASVLGIAQPALSRQIRLLEEDLGVKLFHRTARGVELTDVGERLRATTSAPLHQLELAMRYVGSPLARVERGLHLGFPPTVAGILAVPLLDSLGTAFPKVHFHITIADTDRLVEGMLKGEVDIAIIDPMPDNRLIYRDLLVEDLLVVGGCDSDLDPNHPITFAELADLALVLPASATGIRTIIEHTALRMQIKLESRFVTDSLEVTKNLLHAGRGHSILPLSACAPEIENGRLRYAPVREPSLTQRFVLAVTSQLELPTGFATRATEIIREEAIGLIRSNRWTARILPS
jgi:LysR family nitrogen assimilation transcriptional regulator